MARPLLVREFEINSVTVKFIVTKKSTDCHIALNGKDFEWKVDETETLNRTLAITYYNAAVDQANDNADFDWIGRRKKQVIRQRTFTNGTTNMDRKTQPTRSRS